MDTTRRLWLGLAALLVSSFGVLLWMGNDIYQQAPPIPERVISQSGTLIYSKADYDTGRQVWQSMGGQQLGSIWGHGALVAPDWSADWLHREAIAMLELAAQAEMAKPYSAVDVSQQARLQANLQTEMRSNTFDTTTNTITVSERRAQAIAQVDRKSVV